MDRYFDLACEVETIIDNALNRCFQLDDDWRQTKRIIDHAFYLRSQLYDLASSTPRASPYNEPLISRSIHNCQTIFQGYCVLLDDIYTSRSPELLVKRLQPDIAEFRARLDIAHGTLSRAIDEYEEEFRRRIPPPPPRQALPMYEQQGFQQPVVIINSQNTTRPQHRHAAHPGSWRPGPSYQPPPPPQLPPLELDPVYPPRGPVPQIPGHEWRTLEEDIDYRILDAAPRHVESGRVRVSSWLDTEGLTDYRRVRRSGWADV